MLIGSSLPVLLHVMYVAVLSCDDHQLG